MPIIAAVTLSLAILAAAVMIANAITGAQAPSTVLDYEDDFDGVHPMTGYCVLRLDVEELGRDEKTGEERRNERYWMVKCTGQYVVSNQAHRVDIPAGSRIHLLPGAPSLSYETMKQGERLARLCDVACWYEPGTEDQDSRPMPHEEVARETVQGETIN